MMRFSINSTLITLDIASERVIIESGMRFETCIDGLTYYLMMNIGQIVKIQSAKGHWMATFTIRKNRELWCRFLRDLRIGDDRHPKFLLTLDIGFRDEKNRNAWFYWNEEFRSYDFTVRQHGFQSFLQLQDEGLTIRLNEDQYKIYPMKNEEDIMNLLNFVTRISHAK